MRTCEFVFGLVSSYLDGCDKQKRKKNTNMMTYRVAAQLKIPTVSFKKIFISQLVFKFLLFLNCLITMAVVLLIIHFNKLRLFRVYRAFHVLPD